MKRVPLLSGHTCVVAVGCGADTEDAAEIESCVLGMLTVFDVGEGVEDNNTLLASEPGSDATESVD